MPEASPGRQFAYLMWRTGLMLVLLTGCYYALPDGWPFDDGAGARRLLASILALAGFALVLRLQVRAIRTEGAILTRVEALLTVLYLLVLGFSATYHEIAVSTVGQFAGLSNRTDALYFTVTVMSTVGFGDIHAVDTAARALVTIQMLFDVIFIGTAVRMLSNVVQQPKPESGALTREDPA